MPRTIGVDVGGTFTDVVVFDSNSVSGWKVPTTPDQAAGVSAAVGAAGIDAAATFLHGTTAGTNALLEGRGARTALVTSSGFEDLIEIGRQARPSLYDQFLDRPAALAPRELRIGYSGDVDEVIGRLEAVEAVAVALVRSYADPSEELELARRISAMRDVPLSVGALVSPAFREYERVATTVLDAYLTPEISGYLSRLDSSVGAGRRLAMTSSGGLLPFDAAAGHAGRLVLSGPAAGVVAATALGRAKGHASVISFDMGGTSTDVCRIDGQARPEGRHAGAGWVNRVPSLPVHTIGAGGGSIAWVDDGGALRVGPRSAGALPGPAAYGLGGESPTVTDANVVLGRIPPDATLGGSVDLHTEAARRVMSVVGARLSLDADAVAGGIIEVVDTHMERALRAVSVEDGADPRDSVLIAFGGAGGLHATRLARRLGVRVTLIPPLSGVFSALGLLLARPSSDAERTVMLAEGSPRLVEVAIEIVEVARSVFRRDHGSSGSGETSRADVRYVGQSHELALDLVPDWDRLRAGFENLHRARFGFDRPSEPVEVVNVRATVSGKAPLSWEDLPRFPTGTSPGGALTFAVVEGRHEEIRLWRRETLPPGFEASGPAAVVERDSVLWLEKGDAMTVDDDGTLRVTW